MGEILQSNIEFTEADVLAETKKELSFLKESIFEKEKEKEIEQKKEWFGDYLVENHIDQNEFPKVSWLGKFLRTFRYYRDIKNIATEKNIPLNYFFALKMIEGEWDPTTINSVDWWAGISQIQPDTFKRFSETHLKKNYKVFSDDPKYSDYDYATLMKSAEMKKQYPEDADRRVAVNKKIAKKLIEIKNKPEKDWWWYPNLMAIDDRFNPQIAIDFSAEYLLYCKKQVNTKTLTDKSRDKYKNDKEFDFEWMLAFNWYNKWPGSFSKNFEWSHITNLKTRIGQYNFYSERLTTLLEKWYDYEEVLLNIKKEEKDWKKIDSKDIKKSENTKEEPKYFFLDKTTTQPKKEKNSTKENNLKVSLSKQVEKNNPASKNTEYLKYLQKSKDNQWYVYKYTIPANITSLLDLGQLYEAFAGTLFKITDASGNVLERPNFPSKEWESFYIKEKI